MSAIRTPAVGEPDRLAALDRYDILDTAAEQGFDDVVLLAAQVCGTAVALVSLVARDRQWFKARTGLALRETPIAQSVCAHALTTREVLVIPDLRTDPRTRDNPLVTGEAALRFYAGAPLLTPEGHVIGTLCVVDGTPRPGGLGEAQRTALEALARQVMAQLELRRAVENREQALAARARAEEQMRLAADATGIGVFDFDPVSGELRWDARVRALFGVPARGPVTYAESFLAGVHPDDRAAADAAVQAALDPAGPRMFDTEYRVLAADTGTERWLAARGRAIVEEGRTVRFIGTVRDVTLRRRAEDALRITEERLSLAFEASGSLGWWDWDIAADRLYAGEAFARLFGVDPTAAAAGAPIADFVRGIHPEDRDWVGARIRHAVDTAGEFAEEYRLLGTEGAVFWVYARGRCYHDAAGRPTRFPGVALDITVRKASEERAAATTELGDRLRGTADAAAMAYIAAEIMGRTLNATRAGYGAVDLRTETVTMETDWCRAGVASISGVHRFREYGSFLDDLRRGEMVVLADAATDPRTCDSADAFAALGIRTLVNVPLVEHGVLVAVLFIHHDRPHVWTEADLAFVRGVADRTRAAIARVRAEEQQRLLAHELSHRLKNTLAMVQAIVSQTLRNTDDLATAQGVLAGRLIALGQAHDILMTGEGESADLRAVIERALRLHDDQRPGRFRIDGPRVRTGAKAALSLALMMHELATNATKYGALSEPGGTVSITWVHEGTGIDAAIVLTWREAGGPAVRPPTRRGFGSRLIARGLAGTFGGEVDLAFPPEGVVCRLSALLSGFQHES